MLITAAVICLRLHLNPFEHSRGSTNMYFYVVWLNWNINSITAIGLKPDVKKKCVKSIWAAAHIRFVYWINTLSKCGENMQCSPTWSGKVILANSGEDTAVLQHLASWQPWFLMMKLHFVFKEDVLNGEQLLKCPNMESVRPLGHKNGSYCFSCSPLHLNQVCMTCVENQN